jgi:hypothetical protein
MSDPRTTWGLVRYFLYLGTLGFGGPVALIGYTQRDPGGAGRALGRRARRQARVDRIACPWLIRRFIGPKAEFLFVAEEQVMDTARREGALPFDVPGVELGHHGDRCSFDAFLDKSRLSDPALRALGEIVRGADTDARGIAREAWGLYAVASGFRAITRDDVENMAVQFPVYDTLYAYCRNERA